MACPLCKESFSTNFFCSNCDYHFNGNDFRPREKFDIEIPAFPSVLDVNSEIIQQLEQIDTSIPILSYEGPKAKRDSSELMSEISRRIQSPSNVLDLGCGPKDQCEPVNYLGHNYVGIDYSNGAADLLADAHAIPFKSNSFDCVFSYAVLEHMYNPIQAIREVERVLKPGGIYVGTVSQGEPFHHSFFHLTPWGLLSLINVTRSLSLKKVWGTRDTISALASMGRYPRVISIMMKALHNLHVRLPFLAPRKLKWPTKEKELDYLFRSGSLGFVIEKEALKNQP